MLFSFMFPKGLCCVEPDSKVGCPGGVGGWGEGGLRAASHTPTPKVTAKSMAGFCHVLPLPGALTAPEGVNSPAPSGPRSLWGPLAPWVVTSPEPTPPSSPQVPPESLPSWFPALPGERKGTERAENRDDTTLNQQEPSLMPKLHALRRPAPGSGPCLDPTPRGCDVTTWRLG